jgi:hypothetical protein
MKRQQEGQKEDVGVVEVASTKPVRVVVAVSGTIQDGFELRSNIDWKGDDGETGGGGDCPALLLGYGLCKGAKMYFDVKDEESREYDLDEAPHRVNPAMVLTGDARDANVYALYAVEERACLNALLGEPRVLSMTPDAARIELDDPLTSPALAKFARLSIGDPQATSVAVLTVVAVRHLQDSFVAAPPIEIRPDGTRVTSFHGSLSKFAGLIPARGDASIVDASSLPDPTTNEWRKAVSGALATARQQLLTQKLSNQSANGNTTAQQHVTKDDSIYATDKTQYRLSRRLTPTEFSSLVQEAGITL